MRRSRVYKATALAAATVGATAFAVVLTASPSTAAPAQTLNHWVHWAPEDAFVPAGQADAPIACQRPAPDNRVSTVLHCMTPAQMRAAYGITDQYQGEGQTIVLVDSFGDPTAAQDLNFFAQTFGMPTPHFDQVFVGGKPGYLDGQGKATGAGSGQNGPSSAEGWATEAALDVQWAYAMAPKAHIVLLATNTAETQGVPGLPAMMHAIDSAIDTYPAGTVFSMSFGTDESAFAGAAAQQFANFDETFKKGLAKGDTFLSSSGDNGSVGVIRAHRASATSPDPQVSYPNVSPYVTSVGGTQRQFNWTWDPTGPDVPIAADGSRTAAWWAWDQGGSSEAVGNEPGFQLVTGGGTSSVYARPSFQDGVASVVGSHRGVPDLAWNMAINGGALVFHSYFPAVDGPPGWYLVGGTSASSPQVAGVVALANEARAAAHKAPIGNLNQAIYSARFNQTAAFNDIVPQTYGDGSVPSAHLQSNQLWDITPGAPLTLDSVTGHATTAGYDLTTGWGSPKGMAFVDALAALP
ncbi:MAG: S53 family peptidase [Actinobacteria bacterium]|nr:S53 family peptidase [Actinomycetota bacterium]